MSVKWFLAAAAAAAAISASAGSSHEPHVSMIRVPHGGIQPQAVVDEQGILHLLYFLGDPKAGDLYYVKSRDSGATWSEPLRVNSESSSAVALGTIRGGQIAIGNNGRVHVAWNGSSAAATKERGAPMLYSRLDTARAAFETQRNLMTRTSALDGGGTVAADSEGRVYVAWHGKGPGAAEGEAGRQVWVAVSRDDGSTFAAEHPAWTEPTGACACCGMAAFAGKDGLLHLLYRSATDGVHRDIYLLTSRDGGRDFAGRRLHTWNINACPMSSMAFAQRGGTLAGAWETGGQVYFENLSRTGASPVSAPGEGKGRKHPRVAIGRGGEILMAWTEGTGWQRGGSLAWQFYDANGNAIGEKRSADGVPAWSFGAVVATPGGFLIVY